LTPQVIRKDAKGTTIKNSPLSRLLSVRPCPEASTYDFLYRMASDLVYSSNAFAICLFNEDYTEITAIQPVTVRGYKIFDCDGVTFFRFTWDYDGESYTVPYRFVIHLKGRYNRKRFVGTSPDAELKSSIDLLQTTYDGIRSAVKNSASLRGYLKYNDFVNEDDLKRKVKEFQEAYMSANNNGGIAGLDSSMEFKEISQRSTPIPVAQVSFFRDNIYRYYGVNEKILTSEYNEAEWNSFYENVIEPIATQLSLEFTFKLFSERERSFGNKVVFTTDRLQYATLTTRNAIAKDLFDRGICTINEYREIMYLPQIDGGDVRMVSLNYVKADEQSEYQIGKKPEEKPPDEPSAAKTIAYIETKLKGA
ncbi:MAG: phage portal protein, partial [Clostridia bacterium]